MKTKELFIIALTIFFTIIAWIMADIFHIINTEKKVDTSSTMQPIKANIDLKVFTQLEQKK